jgi:hypothetical protein
VCGNISEKIAMSETKQPKKDEKKADWRDKPVESEADKDIKEGGIGGVRKEQGKENPE